MNKKKKSSNKRFKELNKAITSKLIVYLLILKCSSGFIAIFLEIYQYFFLKILTFLAINKAAWTFWAKQIDIFDSKIRMAI